MTVCVDGKYMAAIMKPLTEEWRVGLGRVLGEHRGKERFGES